MADEGGGWFTSLSSGLTGIAGTLTETLNAAVDSVSGDLQEFVEVVKTDTAETVTETYASPPACVWRGCLGGRRSGGICRGSFAAIAARKIMWL